MGSDSVKAAKAIAKRMPANVVHKIKNAATEKIAEAEKTGDAIRRLDLKKIAPSAYNKLIDAVGDQIREQYDPNKPKKSITIPIPLPTDEDFKMQIHVGGNHDKPKILLEFGARF